MASFLLILFAEQIAGLSEYDWQFEFQYVPHDTMIDPGITVGEYVAERDDAVLFADL